MCLSLPYADPGWGRAPAKMTLTYVFHYFLLSLFVFPLTIPLRVLSKILKGADGKLIYFLLFNFFCYPKMFLPLSPRPHKSKILNPRLLTVFFKNILLVDFQFTMLLK